VSESLEVNGKRELSERLILLSGPPRRIIAPFCAGWNLLTSKLKGYHTLLRDLSASRDHSGIHGGGMSLPFCTRTYAEGVALVANLQILQETP
jgi:hypothetical protein